MLILPTFTNTSAYHYEITLDGRDYILRFAYDARFDTWHFDVLLIDETPLAQGVRIVAGIPLLKHHHDVENRLPPGAIVAIDLNRRSIDPGREITERHRLIYFTAAELAALGAPSTDLKFEFQPPA